MIGMIGHLGQVSTMRGRVCALWHLLGVVIGAAAAGFVLGLVGTGLRGAGHQIGMPLLPFTVMAAEHGLLAVLCGLREFRVLTFPLPQPRRQVPRGWWYTMGTRRASLAWGVMMGAGLFTFIEYPIYYLVLALAFTSTPVAGCLLMTVCGLGQGLAVLGRTVQCGYRPGSADSDPDWSRRVHRLAGWAAVAFAGYLLVSSLGELSSWL